LLGAEEPREEATLVRVGLQIDGVDPGKRGGRELYGTLPEHIGRDDFTSELPLSAHRAMLPRPA
jgi:hypothetical protein